MKPIPLIVDVDETVLNPIPSWIAFIRSTYGISLTQEEVGAAGSVQSALHERGVGSDVIREAEAFRSASELNARLPAVPGSIETLRFLEHQELGRVECYLTARPASVSAVTYANLKDVGAPEARAEFLDAKRETVVWAKRSRVKAIAATLGNIAILDDNVDLISSLLEQPEQGVLPICILGPFRAYQLRRAQELGVGEHCIPWQALAAKLAGPGTKGGRS